jgi:hypothetical protein
MSERPYKPEKRERPFELRDFVKLRSDLRPELLATLSQVYDPAKTYEIVGFMGMEEGEPEPESKQVYIVPVNESVQARPIAVSHLQHDVDVPPIESRE